MAGSLAHAAHVLRRGGIVAYATEYCYGLGCDPFNERAVTRLLRLKRRPPDKGLIVLAADLAQLEPLVDDVPAAVARTWPGPHTWLLTPRTQVPHWITGAHARVALRVTAHAQAAALCRQARMAIVSTSANRTGERPARSFRDVARRLGREVDYVLPGRVGTLPAPTPIRDAVTGEVVRGA